MSAMNSELYTALIEAGVTEEKAKNASVSVFESSVSSDVKSTLVTKDSMESLLDSKFNELKVWVLTVLLTTIGMMTAIFVAVTKLL